MRGNSHCQALYWQIWSLVAYFIYSCRMAAGSGICERGISSLEGQGGTEAAPDHTESWDRARVTSLFFPVQHVHIFLIACQRSQN